MARSLGRYARDQKLMPLEEAIRKITSMPAQRERLVDRGLIKTGFYADVTVFDPDAIIDEADLPGSKQAGQGR
jgi:N-acyl-D-amino-acid deacylase